MDAQILLGALEWKVVGFVQDGKALLAHYRVDAAFEQPIALQSLSCFIMGVRSSQLGTTHITKTTGRLRGRLLKGGEDKIRTCGRVTPTAV